MSHARLPVSPVGKLVLSLVTLLFLSSLSFVVTPADAHFFVKGGKKCRPVAYQWGTDWASSSIQVRGIGCRKARFWIRRDKGSINGIPWRNCVRRDRTNSGDRWSRLADTDYRYVSPNGSKKIVWIDT